MSGSKREAWWPQLAADYVCGSMRGGARRRFVAMMASHAALRQEVSDWEDKIYPLAWALPERQPPARVWRAVQARIRGPGRAHPWGWRGLNLWRLASGVLACALVAVVVVDRPRPGPETPVAGASWLAVLQTPQAQALAAVRTLPDGAVRIQPLQDLNTVAAGRTLELWALPPGQPPRSLGLLAMQGVTTLSWPAGLAGVQQLAVSLEPPGGSPTGQPTGPVVLSGSVLAL